MRLACVNGDWRGMREMCLSIVRPIVSVHKAYGDTVCLAHLAHVRFSRLSLYALNVEVAS